MRRLSVLASVLVLGLVSAGVLAGPSMAQPVYTGIVPGIAVGGYDPVAYFTEGRPVPGRPDITAQHAGVIWRFGSAENRAAFVADPARFAPQYGGYCAWAAAQGYAAKGDPRHWAIVDGRLYLNYDAAIHRRWQRDVPGFVRRADVNWPNLRF